MELSSSVHCPAADLAFGFPRSSCKLVSSPSDRKELIYYAAIHTAHNTVYLSSKKSGLIEHDMLLILMPARMEKELLPRGSGEHVKPSQQSNEHTLWLLHYTVLIPRNEKGP